MAAPKPDKIVPLRGTLEVPAFVFGATDPDDEPEIALGLPSSAKARATDSVVQGVDLSGVPKVVLLAGRGKTGKTTAIRWMAELALAAGRPLLMGDLDPTNASFGTYFEGVHQPADRDNPAGTLKWLEEFIGHATRHRQTTVIDLGGGDTTLRRLADELPDLPQMAADEGAAIVVLYHIGPQLDDLAPIAAMAQRDFKPQATAVVMNEAGVEPGLTREQAFVRVCRHSAFRDAVARGAVPVWMPRLLVAERIEARRAHFLAARDGLPGDDGAAILGPFDRARARQWLDAMDRQFAGIRTWLP